MRITYDDLYSMSVVHGEAADPTERHAAQEVAAFFREVFHLAPVVRAEIAPPAGGGSIKDGGFD